MARSAPKRIGIFGGTFDPVHEGHVRLAKAARKALKLDAVYFVPSYITPLKGEGAASAFHRSNMIRLAIRGIPFAKLSRCEIQRKKISYTVDTVGYFRRRFGRAARLYFLCGSDVLSDLRRWRKLQTVLKDAVFAVAARSDSPDWELPRGFVPVPMELCGASSRELRQMLRTKGPARGVPPAVLRYIRKRGLYV